MNIDKALSELDLRRGATEEQIRTAYRILVAKWHPDKHQNDPIRLREAELRIKNINRAFEVLQKAGFKTEKRSEKTEQKTEQKTETAPIRDKPGWRKPLFQIGAGIAFLLLVFFGLSRLSQPIPVPEAMDALQKKVEERQNANRKLQTEVNSLKEKLRESEKRRVDTELRLEELKDLVVQLEKDNDRLRSDRTSLSIEGIAELEKEFGETLYWDWVDLRTPFQVAVRSLYKADVIFKKKANRARLEHWPKDILLGSREGPRQEGATQYDHDYRILGCLDFAPEVVVVGITFEKERDGKHDEGIWLWNKSSGLLFPLGKVPYVGRKISGAERKQYQAKYPRNRFDE